VKRVRFALSDAAVADIVEQSEWYVEHSGTKLAKRWEKAVTAALRRILRNASAGTPCTFRSAALRNVRRVSISGFPKHLLFYKIQDAEIFVLRIVHGARDLESLF